MRALRIAAGILAAALLLVPLAVAVRAATAPSFSLVASPGEPCPLGARCVDPLQGATLLAVAAGSILAVWGLVKARRALALLGAGVIAVAMVGAALARVALGLGAEADALLPPLAVAALVAVAGRTLPRAAA